MWRLGRTESFVRGARRVLERDPRLKAALATTLERLERDPHDARLHLHALRGRLEGLWAVRVTYSIRPVITLDETARAIVLVDLGSHDQGYR